MRPDVMEEHAESLELKINDRLQVRVKGTDEEVPTTYLSRVEDLQGGDIVISWPTFRGIRAPVRDEDVLLLAFVAETSVFSVDARIVRRVSEPLPLLTVRQHGAVTKVQRREYVRAAAMVGVELAARVVSATGGGEGPDVNIIATRTVNISGGGFAIYHPAPPPLGNLYDVKLLLPNQSHPLLLTAKVVRCESVENPQKERQYDVGFAFIQIAEAARRQIVRYIFRLQQSSLVRE